MIANAYSLTDIRSKMYVTQEALEAFLPLPLGDQDHANNIREAATAFNDAVGAATKHGLTVQNLMVRNVELVVNNIRVIRDY